MATLNTTRVEDQVLGEMADLVSSVLIQHANSSAGRVVVRNMWDFENTLEKQFYEELSLVSPPKPHVVFVRVVAPMLSSSEAGVERLLKNAAKELAAMKRKDYGLEYSGSLGVEQVLMTYPSSPLNLSTAFLLTNEGTGDNQTYTCSVPEVALGQWDCGPPGTQIMWGETCGFSPVPGEAVVCSTRGNIVCLPGVGTFGVLPVCTVLAEDPELLLEEEDKLYLVAFCVYCLLAATSICLLARIHYFKRRYVDASTCFQWPSTQLSPH